MYAVFVYTVLDKYCTNLSKKYNCAYIYPTYQFICAFMCIHSQMHRTCVRACVSLYNDVFVYVLCMYYKKVQCAHLTDPSSYLCCVRLCTYIYRCTESTYVNAYFCTYMSSFVYVNVSIVTALVVCIQCPQHNEQLWVRSSSPYVRHDIPQSTSLRVNLLIEM